MMHPDLYRAVMRFDAEDVELILRMELLRRALVLAEAQAEDSENSEYTEAPTTRH